MNATYLKVRQGGRILSLAAIIVVGVNTDDRREVFGVATANENWDASSTSTKAQASQAKRNITESFL